MCVCAKIHIFSDYGVGCVRILGLDRSMWLILDVADHGTGCVWILGPGC